MRNLAIYIFDDVEVLDFAGPHWKAIDAMEAAPPNTTMLTEERWVDNGRIVLSAGISAELDMSPCVISKLLGKKSAEEIAECMQYEHRK